MPSFDNQIWTAIGVIATILFGIVAIVATIIAFLQLKQNQKGLSYRVQSITPVTTLDQDFKDKIEIRHNGNIIQNVYLVILEIVNSGRSSIKVADYERAITILSTKGEIVDAIVAEQHPSNLGNLIENIEKEKIVIHKILLNRGD